MGVKKEKRRQLFNATEIKRYHSLLLSQNLLASPREFP